MSDPQPKWRKVLISGSNAHVAALTASAIANTHGDAQSPGVEEQVLVYNTSSGAIYYTGSFGTGGGGGAGNPSGNDGNIQFNDNGSFGGSDNFIFDSSGDTSLFVDGPITGSIVSASGVISGSTVVATSEFKLAKTSNPVGITQENAGGSATMEFTTTDGSSNQASRIIIRGNNDTPDIEFYTGASGSELGNTSTSGLIAAFGGDNKNFAIGNLGTGSALATNTSTSKFIVEGNITTTGSSGHITASGNISASNNIFVSTSLSASHVSNNVVLVNTATGELYHTGSYGSGGSSVGTLQQVTDAGAVTTTAITSSELKVMESGLTYDPIGGTVTIQYSDSQTNVATNLPATSTVNHHLVINNINATVGSYAALDFRSDNADGRIAYVQDSTSNTGHFSFVTDNGSVKVEKVRIEANGDFKILDGDISSSGELSAATVTGFISADGANRVLTSDGDGTFTAEDSLTYNGTTFALQTQNIDMQAASDGFDLTGNITASGNISASGDLSINGITNVSSSIFDAASSGGGGVVTGYTNGGNNKVITSTGTSTINAEGGLLFDSSTNLLEVGASSANRVTLSGASGDITTTGDINIGNNSTSTNVNALIKPAPKNGPNGYYSGKFIDTADTTEFSTDGMHTGEFITAPSSVSMTQYHIVYLRANTTGWSSANANAAASSTALLGIATDSTTSNRAMARGYIRLPATQILGNAPNIGDVLFISTGSNGSFQTQEPSTTNHISRRVGHVIQSVSGRTGVSSYIISFNPSIDFNVK